MAALILSASRVQLWARGAQPAEQFALHVMLFAQAGASALLFPWLMRDARATSFVVGSAIPSLLLAGMLAESSFAQNMRGAALLVVWLISLSLWNRQLKTRTAKLLGVTLASLVCGGGTCVLYLQTEFVG
jgi:hypothetical protein